MSSISRKIMKKNEEKEKYSYISVEDLNSLQNRCILLSNELKSIDIMKNPNEYKVRLKEFTFIFGELKKYKKYAKK